MKKSPFQVEKLEKTEILLNTHKFEFLLLKNPEKCIFMLENEENFEENAMIFVFFANLAKKYKEKNVFVRALRKYLKISMEVGGNTDFFTSITISLKLTYFPKFHVIEKFCKKSMRKMNISASCVKFGFSAKMTIKNKTKRKKFTL